MSLARDISKIILSKCSTKQISNQIITASNIIKMLMVDISLTKWNQIKLELIAMYQIVKQIRTKATSCT